MRKKIEVVNESSNKVAAIMCDVVVNNSTHKVRNLFAKMLPTLDEVDEIQKFINEYRKIALDIAIANIDAKMAELNELKKSLMK